MALWIYTSETLPNPDYFGKPGYSPEWFQWHGIQLPVLNKKEWAKLPDSFYTMHHKDWRDKAGTRDHVAASEIGKAVTVRWGSRGVVVLDHEPDAKEKAKIARDSEDANLAFRMRMVEEYEERLKQKAVGEKVATRVTPYENECYEVLGLTKPYSVEAMRAQRHPGEAVGEQIVAALDRLYQRLEKEQAKPAATK